MHKLTFRLLSIFNNSDFRFKNLEKYQAVENDSNDNFHDIGINFNLRNHIQAILKV